MARMGLATAVGGQPVADLDEGVPTKDKRRPPGAWRIAGQYRPNTCVTPEAWAGVESGTGVTSAVSAPWRPTRTGAGNAAHKVCGGGGGGGVGLCLVILKGGVGG